jgi:arylsulfatase A
MGISNRANAFMEQCTRDGIPFFIQLAHHALHYPENSSPAMLEKYARLSGRPTTEKSVQRMAMAEHLDQGVGRVMAKIEELGIADQTYLVFMSDNGGSGGGGNQARPGRREPVRPLSGGKGSLWEGGIRVPLIIRGPGVKAGAVCHERVVGYDLFNTFAEWAGIQDTLPSGVEGGSLVPLLATARGEVSRPNDFLVFHFPTTSPTPPIPPSSREPSN